jgi:nitrosocyanin
MKYLLALFCATLLLVACSQTTDTVEQSQPVLPEDSELPPPADIVEQTPETEESAEFDMEVGDWFFTPESITVKEGQTVTIHLRNVGAKAHGFGLPQFNVNEYIDPGEEKTITFKADKKGTYRVFCTVPCGSGHQTMDATLIVE